MIEMLLCAFYFVLAAIGWPGFNQREKMLATNVAIVWLEGRGPQEENREDGRPWVTVTVGLATLLPEPWSCAQPLPKQNSLFPQPACSRGAGGMLSQEHNANKCAHMLDIPLACFIGFRWWCLMGWVTGIDASEVIRIK